jgi:hypothetical protein
MTEIDFGNLLDDLDQRHDEVLSELDALSQQVESVLTALKPASAAAVQVPAFVDRPQKPQAKRRAQRHAH